MSSDVMKHKGQIGSVECDTERDYLFGKLLYINDLVTYEAGSVSELRKEFQAAVDDYLDTCQELGVEPNKPFKGSFNIRLRPELHRAAAFEATAKGQSLNEWIVEAVEKHLNEDETTKHEHYHTHIYPGAQEEHRVLELDDSADMSAAWQLSTSIDKEAARG